MRKILYFSFGSNCLQARLEERLLRYGVVTKVRTYRLMGWKLVFNATSFDYWTFANIEKGLVTDFVEGVLYELTPKQYIILDRYEGLYYKYYFDLPNGELACTYICTDKGNLLAGKPQLPYLNIIIAGMKENNLKATYNALVKYKKANYKLKRTPKYDEL